METEKKNKTICWNCDKGALNCPWLRDFTPVKGWKAVPTRLVMRAGNTSRVVDSYCVVECPLFKLNKCSKWKIGKTQALIDEAKKLGVSLRTLWRWESIGKYKMPDWIKEKFIK